MQSMGERGEQLNVKALKEQWERNRQYAVAPQGVQITLRLLTIAGERNVATVEQAKECFAKMAEILEAIWPSGVTVAMDTIPYGKATIFVPKAIK